MPGTDDEVTKALPPEVIAATAQIVGDLEQYDLRKCEDCSTVRAQLEAVGAFKLSRMIDQAHSKYHYENGTQPVIVL